MAALIWLVAGLLLAAAEMLTGDLTLLMLGGAALGTAGVTGAFDLPVWGQALVFALSTGLLFLGVRPMLRRKYSTPPPFATNADALPGKSALVLDKVTAQSGQVKLGGEVWTARPLDPVDVYDEGVTVYVMKIDGATAVVWKGP
ncbi:NfeD family protein [Nocardia camponoti]|uniref:NfeD-like C-terminal domain-containing protein n=1 Tax=Nocardia camponoti TaxID=1616106 RepID=A0A917Q9W9_9NOCA|nr:NfeD family protein [Nocardia camponoti]GGK38488.1 hypothetical protein GCM10011591_07770 [Nocardia camponoti]